ncbi:MAG TPA: pitrilysin family protein [Clostridiales bacterium]|nr:pitrilysin family protein [Clostridiales bacterium]HOL92020.1 pitrilysin family protein [Clostridiales bacterium]HPP35794.1 pitrilysin family protein [Clostridiales bacterium]
MIRKFTLKNGVRVVCENIPYVRSVSTGIWVRTGSRNENPKNNGISHFVEHMLFKGTSTRTAAQIAECIDNIGGQINAFTGKECTCFYTKTLDEHIEIALDVLGDMFFNSIFDKKDIALEKKVILEEISMYEDSPEELVHDLLSETVWADSSIGRPILGTKSSLRNINRQMILDYINERYTQTNTVISVVGNYDEDRFEALLEKYFGDWEPKNGKDQELQRVVFKPGTGIKEKDTEQVHICIGYEGIKTGDDDIYPLLAISNILGGGMSSRLYQKIREEKGLVYSIYSYPTTYTDTGLFTIYAGMKPENLKVVASLIEEEIGSLRKNGIRQAELERTKEQMKGNYILGLESTSSRMNSIGKSELLLGYIYTPDEILDKISSITMDDIDRMIVRIFGSDRKGLSVVGKINAGQCAAILG